MTDGGCVGRSVQVQYCDSCTNTSEVQLDSVAPMEDENENRPLKRLISFRRQYETNTEYLERIQSSRGQRNGGNRSRAETSSNKPTRTTNVGPGKRPSELDKPADTPRPSGGGGSPTFAFSKSKKRVRSESAQTRPASVPPGPAEGHTTSTRIVDSHVPPTVEGRLALELRDSTATIGKREPVSPSLSDEPAKQAGSLPKKVTTPRNSVPINGIKVERWNHDDETRFVNGVNKFGVGSWREIHNIIQFSTVRTPVNLKDKWRNLISHGHVVHTLADDGSRIVEGSMPQWTLMKRPLDTTP